MAGRVRIGTSGWAYPHWRGRFYPADLPATRWLEHYATRFDTVELDSPFYRQPPRTAFARWRRAVPAEFLYTVKLHRYLTHVKRLAVDAPMVRRSYEPMAGLGPKLAAVLVQLPPRWRFDADRFAHFAAAVSRRRRRHAIEPRDASWLTDAALDALRGRGFALCVADTPRWPTRIAVTADFVYVRFHGPAALYASPYDDGLLREWAARIRGWRDAGLDVLGYFNNDARAFAPRDALRLRELVG